MLYQWALAVINFGAEQRDDETARRVRTLNLVSAISGIVLLTYIIFFILYNDPSLSPLIRWNLLYDPLYLVPILLNRKFSLAISATFAVCVAISTIVTATIYLGTETGLQYFLFVTASAVTLFMRRGQNWPVMLFILLCSSLLYMCETQFTEGLISPFPQYMMESMRYGNGLIAMLMVTLIILYYKGMVYKAEASAVTAHEQTRSILHTVLPGSIADKLEAKDDRIIADRFDSITVLFADIVDFTSRSRSLTAEEVVGRLDSVFSTLDEISSRYNLEKIKTIGDCYMVIGGAPNSDTHHADNILQMAVEIQAASKELSKSVWPGFQMRVGIHSGSAVAGVIGLKKYSYDVWGDTVNVASRLESVCPPGEIYLSEETQSILQNDYPMEGPFELDLKGLGFTKVWKITGEHST